MVVKKIISTKSMLKDAKKSVSDIKKGDTFLVQDLFKGYEWKKLSHKGRIALGTMFYKYALTGGNKEIKPKGKTLLKQQVYKKK